jgi:hypothetical protein
LPPVGSGKRVIEWQGLRELARAFALADKSLQREFSKGLREAADPIRVEAQALASSQISNIGLPWSRMRIGVTRSSVYVAPVERGTRTRRKRPNLANRLLGEALLPALDHNIEETIERVDDVLHTVGRVWESA